MEEVIKHAGTTRRRISPIYDSCCNRDRSREIGPDVDVGASDHHQEDGR
jgi:hypothetical protein